MRGVVADTVFSDAASDIGIWSNLAASKQQESNCFVCCELMRRSCVEESRDSDAMTVQFVYRTQLSMNRHQSTGSSEDAG